MTMNPRDPLTSGVELVGKSPNLWTTQEIIVSTGHTVSSFVRTRTDTRSVRTRELRNFRQLVDDLPEPV